MQIGALAPASSPVRPAAFTSRARARRNGSPHDSTHVSTPRPTRTYPVAALQGAMAYRVFSSISSRSRKNTMTRERAVGRSGSNGLLAWNMDRLDCKKGVNRAYGFRAHVQDLLYGCIDCGDCGLESVAYSCPMACVPRASAMARAAAVWMATARCILPRRRAARAFAHTWRTIDSKRAGELGKYNILHPAKRLGTSWQRSAWSNYTHGTR